MDDMEGSDGPYLSPLPLHIFHHSPSISSTTLPPYLSPLRSAVWYIARTCSLAAFNPLRKSSQERSHARNYPLMYRW